MSKPQLKLFNPDVKTYNHAFELAFQVEGSEYEDGYKCLENESEKVFNAVIKRIDNIFHSQEFLEALDCFDTFEEEAS